MALQESFAKSGNFLFKKRSFLPLLILIPGMAWFVWLNFQKTTITGWWLDLIFLCIGFIGLTIRILTVGFTPKGTSGRNTSEGQVAEVVNTTGIYSVVRHPLYLGNFFMWLAPCLMILDLWFILFFCLAYWLYYERIMYAEEDFLRKKFGDQYLNWANVTPAFIPNFSKFKKSNMTFSVRNVLKREYNGFFNLILIMTFMRYISHIIVYRNFCLDIQWIIIFSVGLLIFLVLKILKKYTNVLNVEGR